MPGKCHLCDLLEIGERERERGRVSEIVVECYDEENLIDNLTSVCMSIYKCMCMHEMNRKV